MGLDIRLPIGVMFVIVGALLVLFGLMSNGNTELYRRSLGTNINLWWGLLLLAFGLLMLALARRAKGQTPQRGPDEKK
jgi:protein-S-isoprenylcysteine O-methyltransferase Ste14